jgi:urease accessory protein
MAARRMTTPTENLLLLMAWLSPAFPTGGFAYSHGLEWVVEAGDVHDEPSLLGWLGDVLAHGSGRTDAILLRHAHRADAATLAKLCVFGAAAAGGRERRAETMAQGDAFARAALVWGNARLAGLAEPVPYPVAVGALAGDHGVDADDATAAYLQAWTANLISAAVRLIPLGQTAGLRVLAALAPAILRVARETAGAALEDIGNACFRADIAAMRHETQHTRLFRT